ncbi:MAG: DUF2207 domain-containing protein [Microbacterium sp.]|uniref:hypothetical protein n=1 Tax=Microbacterium sp. TaxID=51671 RepID=UPI0039E378D5
MSEAPEAVSPPPDAVAVETRRPSALYTALSARLLRAESWARSRGSARVRWATRAVCALVAAVGLLLVFGPVINKPLTFDDITSSASSAATEQWIARSFDAEFVVSRDDSGRLRLDVVETIEAFFPDTVDESGIERVVASQLEGHDLRPAVASATVDGVEADPVVEQSPTRTTIRIDAGKQLTGDHVFVLRYSLDDVAHDAFDESAQRDEQVLEWDAFGPSWPQAVAHSRMSITVPRELESAFARQPSGGIEWLLAGDSALLEPDSTTSGTVTYVVENDQRLPPHASFWFRFSFAPGTFDMPQPSALFWVQAVGPFLPLAALAAALLFALAARAVAWGDARGRAWFVHETAPQKGMSPALAARLWRAVRTAPLVSALAAYQQSPHNARAARALVRHTRRAGRTASLASAWTAYLTAPAWRAQFARGLRRVPSGFVRDSFVGAAIALTAVQWGLVRQLSYQLPLTRYWWPLAIVLVSALLAAAVIALAVSARPLTRRGALEREHLMGLALYLQRTSALERSSLRDPLLPYAVAFARPRRARAAITALLERDGLDRQLCDDPSYVGPARMTVRVAAVLVVAAAIAFAIALPLERPGGERDDAAYGWGEGLPGDYGLFVTDFEARGALSVDSGAPRLVVEERLSAVVGSSYREIPQVLRQWQDVVAGHDQRLTVREVTVDGTPAPFTQSRLQGMALLQTHLDDEWPGEHEIVISYELADPVGVVEADGQWREQLTWTALNRGWDSAWSSPDHDVESVAIELAVPTDVDAQLTEGSGWLPRISDGEAMPLGSGARDGDLVVHRDALERDDSGGWVDVRQYDDQGARLWFPVGTFTDGDTAEWRWQGVRESLPLAIPLLLAGLALAAGVAGCVLAVRRPAVVRGGVPRDLVRWMAPALAGAVLVMLLGASITLEADDARLGLLAVAAALGVAATGFGLLLTRRARRVMALPAVPDRVKARGGEL